MSLKNYVFDSQYISNTITFVARFISYKNDERVEINLSGYRITMILNFINNKNKLLRLIR